MTTKISINNQDYSLEINKGKPALKFTTETTETTETTADHFKIQIPSIWVIIREIGTPLFGLKPLSGEVPFRIITAKQLYKEKIQWFEPEADNFRELIWHNADSTNPASDAYNAYKHFEWQQIIDFSIIKRTPFSYYKEQSGDWKHVEAGANQYLLVMVGNTPYWADAIGQIPFAVNTYSGYYARYENSERAIIETIRTGMEWADGTFFSHSDSSNEYDNYMVLRGALWASENYKLTEKNLHPLGYETKISNSVFSPTGNKFLTKPVERKLVEKFGIWKK